MQENIKISSADNKHKLNVVTWKPEGEPKAIFQITHGMAEHITRYSEFAGILAARGFFVIGHDHIGHGESVNDESELGYIADKNPAEILVQDIRNVFVHAGELYPGIPHFIMGHSMGSYLLRKYLIRYSDDVSGVILMGTGMETASKTFASKAVVRMIAKRKGWHFRSEFVRKSSYGKYYKGFDTTGTDYKNSWLSRNEKSVEKYYADPLCGYTFTLNGYQALIDAVTDACDEEKMKRVRNDLPMLFVSGGNDPVGGLSAGVIRAVSAYKSSGHEDIILKLYNNSRHELINEPNKDEVFADIISWVEKKAKM